MTTSSTVSSRWQELWDRHDQQWRRLDELEERIDETVMRKRRRLANLLDETSTHRLSHMRMFVTHTVASPNQWTLVVEGRLLVGHLDHKSAARVEQEAAEAAGVAVENAAAVAAADTQAESDAQQQVLIRSTDRTQYRGISEKEGDVPVEPTRFTHFFDKMTVSFQTVHQPIASSLAAAVSPNSKKSRSKSKRSKHLQDENYIDRRHLTTTTPSTTVVWKRQDSPDAHAFRVNYQEPSPAPENKSTHSVVATISLYPCKGPQDLYQPSPKLAAALFPQHTLTEPSKKKRRTPTKRRPGTPTVEEKEIPVENSIVVPPSITLKEIVSAIFIYARDKKLMEESTIVNDKLLMGLFDCERMTFFELQQRLISMNLVTKLVSEQQPIVLTYIMAQDTATTTPEKQKDDDSSSASMLTFDTNIYVPGMLHFRARELMRRIKRREFEYTSSRTKARNLLMASRGAVESVVKTRIEEAVCGRSNLPEVWLALAKAAPAGSEARGAAQVEAQTCVLMDRLQYHCRAAKAAWEVVDACSRQQEEENNNHGNEDGAGDN